MRFLWLPLISAVLCLSAHAAWEPQPDPPGDAPDFIGDLIERWAEYFGYGKADPEAERLARLRGRLENESDPAERCALLHTLSGLEASRKNFTQAATDLESYLSACQLTDDERRQALLFLGRLYLVQKPPHHEKAIKAFREYAARGKTPDPDAHLYLAQALALAGRCGEAVPEAQKAMTLAKEPREQDYWPVLFCRREDAQGSVALLEKMLTLFPARNEYLGMLAAGYYEMGRPRDAFVLEVLRYELGYMHKEEELVRLARLYLWFDNPWRAARVLEKELSAGRVQRTPENLEELAGMWTGAREHDKERDALIEAAAGRKNGKLELRIALSYLDAGNPDKAEFYLRRALSKGGLMLPCAAHILLAYSLYDRNERSGALRQFRRAEQAGCKEETERALQGIAVEIAGTQTGDADSARARLLYERIPVKVAQDERALAASAEALDAAKEALAASTAKLRQSRLADYEDARAAAGRHLDDGALESAREDCASIDLLRAALPADRLPAETLKRVRQLHILCRRRVALLEGAQDNLERAANLAAQSRRKDAPRNAG